MFIKRRKTKGWTNKWVAERELHTYPIGDKKEHILSNVEDCFCRPETFAVPTEDGMYLLPVHRAADGRM